MSYTDCNGTLYVYKPDREEPEQWPGQREWEKLHLEDCKARHHRPPPRKWADRRPIPKQGRKGTSAAKPDSLSHGEGGKEQP